MTSNVVPKWNVPAFFLILFVIGFLLYANTLRGVFQFDDLDVIVHNSSIKNIYNLSAPIYFLENPTRIVVLYSFAINFWLGRLDPFGYHLVNILIHIANSLLVWWATNLLLNTKRVQSQNIFYFKILPILTALFFLVHPIQTQAVAYITQRFASLATLFYLLAICFFIKGKLANNARYFLISAFWGLLSMFSKEISFTLPIMIYIIDRFFFYEKERAYKYSKILSILILLGACLIVPLLFKFNIARTLFVEYDSQSHAGDILTTQSYFLTQFKVFLTYLRLILFPINQNLDYDFPIVREFLDIGLLFGFVIVSMLLILAFKIRNRFPITSFGIWWFFITLSVESSIFPIRHVIFEHRLYLPMFGCALIFSDFLVRTLKRSKFVLGTAIIILGILGTLTINRNQVWQDELSLWSDVVKKSPYKARPWIYLGQAYIDRNDFNKAILCFNEALKFAPKSVYALNKRALAFIAIGNIQQAKDDLDTALQIAPDFYDALNNRAVIFAKEENYEAAIDDLNKAIQYWPKKAELWVSRGNLWSNQKNFNSAIIDYTKAIEIDGYNQEAFINRGNKYAKLGNYNRALSDYQAAININPNNPEAFIRKAQVYEIQGKKALAILEYEKALRINPADSKISNKILSIK